MGRAACRLPLTLLATTAMLAVPLICGTAQASDAVMSWGDRAVVVSAAAPHLAAVAAGDSHALGLNADGSIVAWGLNDRGQCVVPAPNAGFIAVAAGTQFSVGLKADGSIVAWGRNDYGQCAVPEPNTGFTALAAGLYHSVGLKADGSVVLWGWNNCGQCTPPSANSGFTAVAAGDYHCAGLKEDGSIVAWGYNASGQCNVPSPNTRFAAVAASGNQTLGLKRVVSVTGVGDLPDGRDKRLSLTPQPNPFNPLTTIRYSVSQPGRTRLTIYDLRGARVAVLVDEDRPAGEQSVAWDGRGDRGSRLPSGVYFARLVTVAGVRTVKVTLAK